MFSFTPDGFPVLGPADVGQGRLGGGGDLADPRRRGRAPHGRLDHRWRARVRYPRDGHRPVRARADLARLRPRPRCPQLRRGLRPGPSAPAARRRPAAADGAVPRATRGARRRVLRGQGLGACPVVRHEPGRSRGGAHPAGRAQFWSTAAATEHRATREACGPVRPHLADQGGRRGPGRRGVPAAHRHERPVRSRSGPSCTRRSAIASGGIRSDITFTRLAEDRYQLGCNGAAGRRLPAPMRGATTSGSTSRRSPRGPARSACGGRAPGRSSSRLSPDDLLERGVPVPDGARDRTRRTCRSSPSASRTPGELGWELYAEAAIGRRLWDVLWAAGREHGLVACGRAAYDGLRMEKGYRAWGSDMTVEDDPYQAGIGFTVKLGKGDFVGREALAAKKAAGRTRGLAWVALDDPADVVLGKEPVFADDQCRRLRPERRLRLQRRPRPHERDAPRRTDGARHAADRSSGSAAACRRPWSRIRSGTRPANGSGPRWRPTRSIGGPWSRRSSPSSAWRWSCGPRSSRSAPCCRRSRRTSTCRTACSGALSAIPILCMGLFAPLGARVGRRLGGRNALALCAGLVIAFGLIRVAAPSAWLVLLLTFGIGLGMGLAGPILPDGRPPQPAQPSGARDRRLCHGPRRGIARRRRPGRRPGRPGRRLAAVARADVRGRPACRSRSGWSSRRTTDRVEGEVVPPHIAWSHPAGWVLGLLFGLQSIVFYGVAAWLAAIYVDLGWTEADAAQLVAVFIAFGLVATVTLPLIADRVGTRRGQLVASAMTTLIGLIGLAVAPGSGVPVGRHPGPRDRRHLPDRADPARRCRRDGRRCRARRRPGCC